MQPILIALAIFLAIGGAVQVVTIVKIAALRKRLVHLPHLSEQPAVRKWLIVCGSATLSCTLATVVAVSIAQKEGQVFLIGLATVLLMVVAYTVADNGTEHGDGDSGG